jgi:membrane-bound serine protease (ClpP class)
MRHKKYTTYAIVTTLLEEAALVAVVLWLLPRLGIDIPLWGLILMVVALGTYALVTYRLGKRALDKKPITSLDIGSRGRATTSISPTGYVRVNGELWQASSDLTIGAGEEITVVGMKGMTLLVSPVKGTSPESRADNFLGVKDDTAKSNN